MYGNMLPQRVVRGGVIAVLLILAVFQAHAEDNGGAAPNSTEDNPSFLDTILGWTITPGVGVRVVTLGVTRKSDGFNGTLTNDGSFSEPIYFTLGVETPGWMLTDSVGFSVRSHTQNFSLSRQQVPSATTDSGYDYANVGTSVHGYYSYIAPAVFLRLNETSGDSRLGVGYGYWKAWFKGDIILAPDGAAESGMPHTRIKGAINGDIGGNTGPIFFLQARDKKFVFDISVSAVSFSNSEYNTTLREVGMSINYFLLL